MWSRANRFAGTLFSEASPRAIVLASPYILRQTRREDLVQRWAAAASIVPYTEEVAQSVVDTLLQIVSNHEQLVAHVTVKIWSWLTKRPFLPPVSMGRYFGTRPNVVKAVRRLNDTEILKSYLLLLWSEWIPLWDNSSLAEMCASVREEFSAIGMGHHRVDLIQRLDHTLAQLDRGLEYLKHHNPLLEDSDIWVMRDQYGKLKDILLETNLEAIARMSCPLVRLLRILTQVDMHRVSHDVYVCAASPVSIGSRL